MKVLSVTFSDYKGAGGTSIASYELHRALKKAGIDSKILCRMSTSNSSDSTLIKRPLLVEGALRRVFQPLGFNDLHGISAFGIADEKVFREADLVHFHSLHSGYFNIFALPHLSHRKPSIWTLHDVWAITGHCGGFYECERWKTGCGKCPYPQSYPPIRRDATHWEWKLKRCAYRKSRLHLVVASRWFEERVKESILSHLPVHRIPWGIDTQKFRPLDKAFCRRVFGIAPEKKVILFVALHLGAYGKGGDLLARALEKMPESLKRDSLLLTMGAADRGFGDVGVKMQHLGWVDSPQLKAMAYSAADVFVSPTRAETFGLTLIESMACATPVASFAVTAVPELVQHRVTGYAARPEDPEDLARGIEEILADDQKRAEWGRQGRALVDAEYRLEDEVKKYIALYEQVLKDPSPAEVR